MSEVRKRKPSLLTNWAEIWSEALLTIGMWFRAYDRKRFFPERVHVFLSVTILSSYIILWLKTAVVSYKTDLTVAILALNYALFSVLAIAINVSILANRNVLYEIDRGLDVPHFLYESHNEAPVKSYNQVFHVASEYILTPFPIVAIVVIFIVPLLTPSSGVKPWTTEDGVNHRLQLITWFPFNCDEGVMYLLVYMSQLYYAFGVTSVYSAAEIFQIDIARYLLLEMEILANSISKLDERVRKRFCREVGIDEQENLKTNFYDDPIFQKSARFCIIENIKHHQKIMEFFGTYCRALSLPSFYAYGIGTAVIAICLITLNSKKNDIDGNFFDTGTVILVFFLVEELLFMFYLSWIGELIITLSFEVNQEIQFIRLDKYDNTFRKYVLTFLQGTTREMVSKSGGYFDCKMEAFSAVINGSYSFFNFANAS